MPTTLETLFAAALAAVPGGITRDGQMKMATAVSNAISTGEHLLVQAGTGTGKSLGYLVPALHSRRRTVIATATVALQTQLVNQDLPRLVKGLSSELEREPRFALLKGRHHYACRAKLASADTDSLFDGEQTWVGEVGRLGAQITAVREWAETSDSGDRVNLDSPVSDTAWRQVSMPATECVGATRCPFGTECFAEEARQAAREADIIVTNHSLLAMDVLRGGNILPEHDVLIIDEAHELQSYVTNTATAQLSPEIINRAARGLGKSVDLDLREQLVESAEALGNASTSAPTTPLVEIPSALNEAVLLVAEAARKIAAALGKAGNGPDADVVSVTASKQALRDICETADRIVANGDHDVIWVSGQDSKRHTVYVAPLSVARLLAEPLYMGRTVVLTSATLTVGGSFDHIAADIGLPQKPKQQQNDPTPEPESSGTRWQGMDVGSPFDYPRQAILYVAAHLPRPGSSGLSEEAAEELLTLVGAAGGRTLGLFSSRKAAEQAAEILRAKLSFPVLLQGDDELGSLVARFRDDPRTCLVGVASLWQGVDAPGEGCQLVVIDRLPFPRPDDPLSSARSRAADGNGSSGFMKVSVPHATVRLAQGVGRLIRSVDDRGVVAILDSRLHHARYGGFMRRSLPPMWYTTDSQSTREALSRLDNTSAATEAAHEK